MVQIATKLTSTDTFTTSRTGVSPIGTTSPNTGSTGATNSTYGQGAFASGINIQGAATAYTVQNTDYQGIIEFNGAAAIAVTLNEAVGTNYTTTILNLGTGAITLTPNGSLTVNGAASLTLQPGVGAQIFFANRQWTAYAGATSFPVLPATTPAVPHEWFDAYDAATGIFTATQPAFADVSGTIQAGQVLSGTSASLGGAALIAGQTVTGTATVTGATTSMTAMCSPGTYPGAGFTWCCYISAADTVTVSLTCVAAATPTASTYLCRVIP